MGSHYYSSRSYVCSISTNVSTHNRQIVELNEIKKLFYKQDPKATFEWAREDGLFYECILSIPVGENHSPKVEIVNFMVPLSEVKGATFQSKMPAKLLIRYIIK